MHRFNTSEVDIHFCGRVDYQVSPNLMRNLRHSYVLGKDYAWMHMYLIKYWLMKERVEQFINNIKSHMAKIDKKEFAFIHNCFIFEFNKLGAMYTIHNNGVKCSKPKPILNNDIVIVHIFNHLKEINCLLKKQLN